jgi:putative transposase
VAHDLRDQVIDFVNRWQEKTGIGYGRFIEWLRIPRSKFYDWKERYGKVNEHNAWIPRDHWLEAWEEQAIEEYAAGHREDGYRRMTFMMLDENVVAVSPSSVYRILKAAGLLRAWNGKASMKGTGFIQPVGPHEHWHTDVSYLNIAGTFYYLCSVLDGYSRAVVHWEIRESMKEADVTIVLQRAREKHPSARPRVISDNGPQFVARDFKEFIRLSGMDHVRTSPFYPQSNGKEERWHQTLKRECIRPRCPLSLEEARRVVGTFVEHYNTRRLHSAIGYVTPQAKLDGREQQIFEERDRKLEAARQRRADKRAADRRALLTIPA